MGSGNLQGNLFTLDSFMQAKHEAKIASQQTEDLWHKRYDQLSQANLRSFQSNNLVFFQIIAFCNA